MGHISIDCGKAAPLKSPRSRRAKKKQNQQRWARKEHSATETSTDDTTQHTEVPVQALPQRLRYLHRFRSLMMQVLLFQGDQTEDIGVVLPDLLSVQMPFSKRASQSHLTYWVGWEKGECFHNEAALDNHPT